MTEYAPKSIEQKWQARWEEEGIYRSTVDWSKPKHYALTMLPYPSGDLHMGHWVAMTPSDARARFMRMRGYNVLFPICLLYTSPSPRDLSTSRMPSSA